MKSDYSRIIGFSRFPLIIFIVALHAYTAITPDQLVGGNFLVYWRLVYIPALVFGEVAVPAFFLISGMLFFQDADTPRYDYSLKLKKRIRTLLVPYLLWNAGMILFYAVIQHFAFTAPFFSGANKPIAEYGLTDFLNAFWAKGGWCGGNSTPILQPLWYIRNLMLLSILSPVILWLLRTFKILPILASGLWWLFTPNTAFTQESLFFFLVGGWLIIRKNDFLKNRILCKSIGWLFFFGVAIDYLTHAFWPVGANLLIHRLTLVTGIFALFRWAGLFTRNHATHMPSPALVFFIYALHYPVVLFIRKFEQKIFPDAGGVSQFFFYLAAIVLTMVICVAIYLFMNRFFPRLLNLLTGNRKEGVGQCAATPSIHR